MDVRVPASKMIDFKAEIWSQSSVMIPNLQELISEQPALPAQGDWNYTDNTFWASYHDMATLNNFTESMIQAYPKLVSRVSIGQTYEGREIFGMSIRGYRNKKKKTNFGEYHDEREEDDDGDDDEEEVDDDELEEVGFEAKIKSWWSWLFGPSRAVKNKPSKPSKHPKAIIIHAGQHARGIISLSRPMPNGLSTHLMCVFICAFQSGSVLLLQPISRRNLFLDTPRRRRSDV